MLTSHFLINWYGNKRCDYINFKDCFDYNDIDNIIEPFCGSCAISFNIWLEHGNKFNYYLNDLDEDLIKVLNLHKNENLNDFIIKLNEEKHKCEDDNYFNNFYKSWLEDKDVFKYIILKKLTMHSLSKKYKRNDRIRTAAITTTKISKIQFKFQEFLRSPNVFITNEDWIVCYNHHKDNEKSMIIFDPPYIDSMNNSYKNNNNLLNVYNNLNDIKNNNAKSYFIIEKIDKILNLFNEWNNLKEYDKIYIPSYRKTIHIIYSNR